MAFGYHALNPSGKSRSKRLNVCSIRLRNYSGGWLPRQAVVELAVLLLVSPWQTAPVGAVATSGRGCPTCPGGHGASRGAARARPGGGCPGGAASLCNVNILQTAPVGAVAIICV